MSDSAAMVIAPGPRPKVTIASSAASLRILLVDDSANLRTLVKGFLVSAGHEISEAEDGEAAVALYAAWRPDLILMDVMMPKIDGIEATRRIRSIAQDDWVPIIIMSALGGDGDVVRALDAGGDDYIVKPVNFAILQAKMRSLQRMLKLHTQLTRFRNEQLQEQELARTLLENIVHRDGLNDPAVKWNVLPSAYFSGDVVAVQRGPKRELYALLGDATGHGLTASMSLIPALQVFYGMARKGLPVATIAREMNAQLKALLPVGRYLAAIIVRVDERNRAATIWNGGMPGGLRVDVSQKATAIARSSHLALGIVGDADFDETCETLEWTQPGQLVVYSDGVIEAENPQGDLYGEARLYQVIGNAPIDAILEDCFSDLRDHVAQPHAHDDASMLTIALP